MAVPAKIVYANNFEPATVRLLELSDDVLNYLKASQKLSIRGATMDEACLCTNDKTFTIKQTDTSNTCLIAKEKDGGDDVSRVFTQVSATYEIAETAPRLAVLRDLLWQAPYSGEGSESQQADGHDDSGPSSKKSKVNETVYTLAQLQSMIAASDKQIEKGLDAIGAVEIDSRWRVLSVDYFSQVLTWILTCAAASGWELNKIPLVECQAESPMHRPEVVECVLKNVGSRSVDEQGATHYALDAKKTCVAFARALFFLKKKWPKPAFEDAWTRLCPDIFQPDPKWLPGLALEEGMGADGTLRALSVNELPNGQGDRMAALFTLRAKWREADIMPYIEYVKDHLLKRSVE